LPQFREQAVKIGRKKLLLVINCTCSGVTGCPRATLSLLLLALAPSLLANRPRRLGGRHRVVAINDEAGRTKSRYRHCIAVLTSAQRWTAGHLHEASVVDISPDTEQTEQREHIENK